MVVASACGKAILFGEHAVVYGMPAIAVPVTEVGAEVTIEKGGAGIEINAVNLKKRFQVGKGAENDPLQRTVLNTLVYMHVEKEPMRITIDSTIPIAAGLGSGAAVSIATIRALSLHYGKELENREVSFIAYETEKMYHGTPSGIDNSVISYEKPIYFKKSLFGGENIMEPLQVGECFSLLIGDSGVKSETKAVVEAVRIAKDKNPVKYDKAFSDIGDIANNAKNCIVNGDIRELGSLMNENHGQLGIIGVSNAKLDKMVKAALRAGALGAKVSGAGRGGNMIALSNGNDDKIASALKRAGAVGVIRSAIG